MAWMAGSEHAGLPADAWLDACRRIVAEQARLYARTHSISARTEYAGRGEGGDRSLVIDREAEEIVFGELAALHEAGANFTAVSEERGQVVFGDGTAPDTVVIDPIDGSLNARRTLPSFALSIAVAGGSTMADVGFGFVHDFGAREEFVAERELGARLDGEELLARGPGYGLELVGLEATKPELILPIVAGLQGKAYRCRGVGSLAITLCYVAGGRFDGMLSARHCRSVDVAAAQLIAREAGASVKFGDRAPGQVGLDLAARFPIAAGLDEEMLGTLLEIQRDAERELA
ncbi:MAG: monophosphatase [Solirubrobacterales bacterium]|jgi:myo-inositol-1(or 4)-monophosphatase|nr:monophosphatase [Solirubrobacterales bacterium]